jgi:hypothetical protein
LNGSSRHITLIKTELRCGEGIVVMGAQGYLPEFNRIVPGGCVVVFFWGSEPSLYNGGHAKAILTTTAFKATVSTKKQALIQSDKFNDKVSTSNQKKLQTGNQ